jgi:hypothetical protein
MTDPVTPLSPSRTLILIGASNVTFNLPDIWQGLVADQPTRLLVAAGHGRSYGIPNTVLGRTLPSLLECGLWKSLPGLPTPRSTPALITDIGNDLLYGATPETIAGWVSECADRFLNLGCRPAVTILPFDSLRRLSRWRFHFFRRILFPASRLSFDDALRFAEELNIRIEELATARNLATLRPQSEWYGLDPIHFRRSIRASAWTNYLSALDESARAEKCSCFKGTRIWKRKAAEITRRGQRLETPQPVLDHAGSELWLF